MNKEFTKDLLELLKKHDAYIEATVDNEGY